MRCIWQMDGDKVKGFKCEFSPIDMLMIVSGLKYIVADIERHPKDRERAQGIYNQIMLCRYYDEADHKTENCSVFPNNCEPKICDTCRYYNSNIPCGSTPGACKEADKFAEEFVDGLKKLKPTISKMEQVGKPQANCGDFADRLAYERGVKHAWEVAQKVFNSTVTFYEAEDVAKQIDKDHKGERKESE